MSKSFFMQQYVSDFDDSRALSKIDLVSYHCSWYWVKIGEQEPFVVYKKWVDEHKALIKDTVMEYPAYMVHELIEMCGVKFRSLERRVRINDLHAEEVIFYAKSHDDYETPNSKTPQSALSKLLLYIHGAK